jgi:hypothetical protein
VIGDRPMWNFVCSETCGCLATMWPVHLGSNQPGDGESSSGPLRFRLPPCASYFDVEKASSRNIQQVKFQHNAVAYCLTFLPCAGVPPGAGL